MYDIHTHLYWESFDDDRDEVIRLARASGIEKMFVVGCTLEESQKSISLAEAYDGLFASVGMHPHFFSDLAKNKKHITREIETLKALAQSSKKVIAIGECGLDYYTHTEEPITCYEKDIQKAGFLEQMKLAKELHLPLIIHSRASKGLNDAYEDLLEILKNNTQSSSSDVPCILHCYMGDTEITQKFLELPNTFFSFTANITYPTKKQLIGTKDDLCETVKMIPLERIFVETDCPFLAPQSRRGKRNDPMGVFEGAEKIANLRGETIMTIAEKTMQNTERIFFVV